MESEFALTADAALELVEDSNICEELRAQVETTRTRTAAESVEARLGFLPPRYIRLEDIAPVYRPTRTPIPRTDLPAPPKRPSPRRIRP